MLWCATIAAIIAGIGLSSCQTVDVRGKSTQHALETAGLERDRDQNPMLGSGPMRGLSPVRASGAIQADEIRIASEYGGRIIEMHVQTGERVETGKLLASLDATPLLDKLTEARTAAAAAQADLDVILAGAKPNEIEAARAALSLALARQEGARTSWKNARAALQNPQDLDAQIIEARTQIKLTEQAAILAEAQLASEQLLAWQKREGTDERDSADWQVKAAEEALAAAQADHIAAQTLLDWLTYIRSEPLAAIAQENATEGETYIAEAGVRIAQARLKDLLAGPMTQDVAVAQARARLAQAHATTLQAQIDRFTLHSPIEGTVLDKVLHAGELAAPAATILTLANLDPVKLTVYVPANQLGRMHLGQTVQVTVDSYPEQAFSGRVTHIGDQPEYTPRNVATQEERLNTFYAVEVTLDNPDHALKPGMPADATFASPSPSDVDTD